jgi:anti-anti-sigma factor
MRFVIEVSHREGAVRLRLRGEFDLAAVRALNAAIDNAFAAPAPRGIVLNLHEVTFLDCAALGALLRGRTVAVGRGLPYRATGARGMPRRVMELTGTLAALESWPRERPAPG